MISGPDAFLQLYVTGEPGATVRVAIDDAGPTATSTLDGAGATTFTLRPTLDPLLSGALVHLAYVAGEHSGPTRTFPISWIAQ